MTDAGLPSQFEIGIAGLDFSGRRLARALAEKRLSIVACDSDAENIKALQEESPGISIHIAESMTQFLGLLRPFRTIVVSGPGADGDLFSDLLGQLEAEDLLIDAAHCHFKDCGRRAHSLAERNVRYLGLGVIDGMEGGLVLLAGGRPEIYRSVRPLLEAMASQKDGEPSLSYLGPAAAAGHFVKMIHDGIEYGMMQLVRETSDLLKRVLVLDDSGFRNVSKAWQMGLPGGCLRADEARWTSQVSHELDTPTPTIDAAVGMRTLSELERKNDFTTTLFRQPLGHFGDDDESIVAELHGALQAAMIITYAQGVAVLAAGSDQYGFGLEVAEVLRLWKGCGGFRAALLDEMASALQATPHLPNLLDDDDLSEKVMEQQERLRHAVWRAEMRHTSVPVLMASLDYLDSYRGAWLPGNLIQAAPYAATPCGPWPPLTKNNTAAHCGPF
jgi:6-phosphogluconate dehydrogenase